MRPRIMVGDYVRDRYTPSRKLRVAALTLGGYFMLEDPADPDYHAEMGGQWLEPWDDVIAKLADIVKETA